MSVHGLPDRTVLRNMVTFMDKLRGMHAQDPLAFEVCGRHVASIIEDQRRKEGHTDPRDDRGSLTFSYCRTRMPLDQGGIILDADDRPGPHLSCVTWS
jgi:hypothetical protein